MYLILWIASWIVGTPVPSYLAKLMIALVRIENNCKTWLDSAQGNGL